MSAKSLAAQLVDEITWPRCYLAKTHEIVELKQQRSINIPAVYSHQPIKVYGFLCFLSFFFSSGGKKMKNFPIRFIIQDILLPNIFILFSSISN